jgi:oligopeptide/dipeptide ABC transporter ATP-binding protein
VPEPVLSIRDLAVHFTTDDGVVMAVDGVTYDVYPGETLGIVGESGSGKSVSTMSILGLIPIPPGKITSGEAIFHGRDLLKLSKKELRHVRGNDMAIIFQDPMTSLNPVLKIGFQLGETIKAHHPATKDAEIKRRVVGLLSTVGIPQPERRVEQYPHEFSGGMRQRAMIAMAIANQPSLLIADEPTTALDVTIQAQIIELIDKLKDDFDSAVVLITHDLGVVADIADHIGVMYAGRIVEFGEKRDLFYDPQHPYTWGLLGSIPRLDRPKAERLHSIEGMPPSLINLPQGCKFRPRCPHAFEQCMEEPELVSRVDKRNHLDRCWLEPATKRVARYQTIEGGQAA